MIKPPNGFMRSSAAKGAARTSRIDPREWISRKPVIKPSKSASWVVNIDPSFDAIANTMVRQTHGVITCARCENACFDLGAAETMPPVEIQTCLKMPAAALTCIPNSTAEFARRSRPHERGGDY